MKKQANIFKKEGTTVNENTDRTFKIFEKFQAQLDQENAERRLHLLNLEQMIQEKSECVQTNQIRESEIKEIAERAMQDKTED